MTAVETLKKIASDGQAELFKSKSVMTAILFFGILTVVGLGFGLHAMFIGYHNAYNTTRELSWGILISTYIFFVVTSTGLCIVSSIGHVFGIKSFDPIAKRAVYLSIITIVSGFIVIGFEIENPERMAIYNMISPNLTSNIWWMGTLYGGYLVLMAMEFLFIHLENHKVAMTCGLLGLISGIAAHSNLGAIFGMLHGREFWYGPYMPIYFIASAAMSGCATIILFTWLAKKIDNSVMDNPMQTNMEAVSKLCTMMIAMIMFFVTWKIITGFVSPGKVVAMNAFLSGPYSINFWGFEVMLGMVLPFAVLLASRFKDFTFMTFASAMMIIGIFFMRYDLVVIGQVVPVFHELGVKEYPGLLQYKPSLHEIMVVVGGISFSITMFLFGEKFFLGHKSTDHH